MCMAFEIVLIRMKQNPGEKYKQTNKQTKTKSKRNDNLNQIPF